LRRAKNKFPGRQDVYISKRWGFTKLFKKEYLKLKETGKLIMDGANVKVLNEHGPLARLPMFKNNA